MNESLLLQNGVKLREENQLTKQPLPRLIYIGIQRNSGITFELRLCRMSNLNSAGCNLIPIPSALSLFKGHLPLCCPSCLLPSPLQAEQSSSSLSFSYCGAQNRAECDKSLPHSGASQDTGIGMPGCQGTADTFNLPLTQISRYLPAELLFSFLFPSLYVLSHSSWRIQHFSLLNFICLVIILLQSIRISL